MAVWLQGIVFAVVYVILSLVLPGENASGISVSIFTLLIIPAWFISLSNTVRRWHDLTTSGWWVLIGLVQVVGGLYSLIMLGFMAGDQGPNDYGMAPDEGAIL